MLFYIDQVKQLAKRVSEIVKHGDVITLDGELGAGKSTFSKFLIEALGFDYIGSPTFSKIITYESPKHCLWHCDLYQMGDQSNQKHTVINSKQNTFNQLNEYIYDSESGILIVEWACKYPNLKLLEDIIEIKIEHYSENQRKISITKHGRFNYITI
ncbi:tRNA (adenosine(37)-N6)-threonylcarbamoyltransferase complex ATPase subunit type 1 TsaE [Candidatus Cytomitobacter primus]|uniref:tRNA threonylcarbamoyladenosine biosynthesis protein TsaE n=1 Tax=Candidatus Cytomitobacter primus TaxID=2066024 RepID=A0A5C0UG18_9PROT|nr:tRNA (adenosine(37)-N6)-threonylcarbamoyltransferase complex ATPase subunit type 1 TsaE [Candidatus Cytomitobacter primus]QEK38621.1 tRNA (adenosine(37)-N6)-threonylcarbamoyltransferase complex ATPase subunit type 1 TsaE [Candidatus Cytomitobacter primus]